MDGNVLIMWAMPVDRWVIVISVQGWNGEPAAPGSRNCGLVPCLGIPSTTGSCSSTEGPSVLLE